MIGLLALFGLYVSVLAELPLYLLLVPAALILFGMWWPGLRYSGAFLVVLGGYPTLLISNAVLSQGINADWLCSRVAFDGIGNPNGGTGACTTISIDLVVIGLVFWTVTLSGVALLYILPQRAHSRATSA